MSEHYASQADQAGLDLYQEIEVLIRKNPWAWQSSVALIGLVGGVLAPLMGAVLDVITWFVNSDKINSLLNVLSIILCAMTIPLLALGAHCLDLLEARTSRLTQSAETPATEDASASASTYVVYQNGKRPLHKTGTLAVLILLLTLPASSKAQHIIKDVPVTDVLPPYNVSVEPSVSSKPNGLEAKPRLSQFLSESESPRRARPAPFDRMLPRAEYIGYIFEPLTGVLDPGPAWPLTKTLWDNAAAQEGHSKEQQQLKPKWQYGGFIDFGYLLDFNHPANRLYRSRGTAFRVDRLYLNMAGAYIRKKPSELSRWGAELTVQAGKDTEVFGFSATAPNIGGYKFLRHLGPANVSYLAPVCKGLTLQAGIFSSLIGYDSLYAKDNFNYTRPWGADFTPYFMMGVNTSYPFSEKLTGTFFLINGYWHLAKANNVLSSGGQLAYKVNPRVTVKETVLFGPHQSNTSFKFWRFLSDTIVERKTDQVTFAFEYTASWERVNAPGRPSALMMSSQFPVRWILNDRWSVAVRPEVFWDRDGRWTLFRQTVKALTTTLEYRLPYQWTNTVFRLEHRFDDSRGRGGGFFRGREESPGVISLTPSQHLLIFALIFTFDSPAHR
jgi:hypothetical protein